MNPQIKSRGYDLMATAGVNLRRAFKFHTCSTPQWRSPMPVSGPEVVAPSNWPENLAHGLKSAHQRRSYNIPSDNTRIVNLNVD